MTILSVYEVGIITFIVIVMLLVLRLFQLKYRRIELLEDRINDLNLDLATNEFEIRSLRNLVSGYKNKQEIYNIIGFDYDSFIQLENHDSKLTKSQEKHFENMVSYLINLRLNNDMSIKMANDILLAVLAKHKKDEPS